MDNSDVLPYCSPNDTLLHSPHLVPIAFQHQRHFIATLYLIFWVLGFCPQLLCLYAISRKHHLKLPCYVLMLYVCVLDLCNITTSLFFGAIFSFFNLQHCKDGFVIIILGYFTLTVWFAYCAAAMILALNRVLEFTNKRVQDFLFDGKRVWAWALGIIGYAAGVQCTVQKPFYYYNPTEGGFNFFTLNSNPINVNHVVNNLFKFFFVNTAYALMWILLKMKKRKGGAIGGQISTHEAKLSIQALIVGILAGFSTVGYLAMSYIPHSNIPLLAPFGELLWASVHGGSAYIYLVMNKSIRSAALKLFRKKTANVSVLTVTVTAMSSSRLRGKQMQSCK